MEPAEDVLPELPVERANAVGESAPAGQAVETAHAGGESVSTPAGQAQEDNKELPSSSNTHPLHLHLQKKTETEDHSNWVSQWVDCPACLMPLRYISPGLQERKEHMLNCRGNELHYMLDQLCPNRGNCHSRDVAHWGNYFH